MSSSITDKIKEGCSQNFHFLEDTSNSIDTLRILLGFSNSSGGEICFGIKKNGKIKGVLPTEIIKEINELVCTQVKGLVYSFEELVIGRHLIVKVSITASADKLSLKEDNDIYTRINNETIVANKIIKRSWLLERKNENLLVNDLGKEILEVFKEGNPNSLSSIYRLTSLRKQDIDNAMSELLFLKMIYPVVVEGAILYQIHSAEN